jgi:hypothetical protein
MSAISTESPAPHRNANTTATRGSGSHLSIHRTPKKTMASGMRAIMPPSANASTPRPAMRYTTTKSMIAERMMMPTIPRARRVELRRGATGIDDMVVVALTSAGAAVGLAACTPAEAV